MNLKEAFQAQNKIGSLMSYIVRYLCDEDNTMTITEKHLRSKALAGQPDESVDASKKDAEAFPVDGLLGLWQKFMQERELLGQAIGKAKASMDFNLDAAVDANKGRRALLSVAEQMASRKSSHELKKGAGEGYVFNNDGNQTSYRYDIDVVKTIDYDRNKVRALSRELHQEADQLSIEIDKALLDTQVDYTLKFDLVSEDRLIIEEMLEQ